MASVMHRPVQERSKGSPYEANVLKLLELDQANENNPFFCSPPSVIAKVMVQACEIFTLSDGM